MRKRGRPLGYKLSSDAKTLISQSHMNRTYYYSKAVVIKGVEYASVTAAAKSNNVSIPTVVYRIKHQWDGWMYK